MNKAIFLDRDGTINIEKNYLYKVEDFEFIPGVVDALKVLQNLGYRLIIITNQSGIARGYYSEHDFKLLNDWMKEELRNQGILIDAVYYCPHLPDAKMTNYRVLCNCRKPKIGLYTKAIENFDIDLSKSYAVGDKIRDCSICKESECKGFLIGNNEQSDTIRAVKNGEYRNIQYAENLIEVAKKIMEDD